jgi:MFS family permease
MRKMEENIRGGLHKDKDKYKFSRGVYIIQAVLEYFIITMAGSTYLAKLALSVGMSDGTTVLLLSFVPLGMGFQIFALFFAHKRPAKLYVSVSLTIVQLCYALLYLTPFFNVPPEMRSAVFILLLLVGEILRNIIFPAQTTWFFSIIDDWRRGTFTAVKEIVFLASGMLFTFIMGRIIDSFEARGEINTAFILCGVTMLGLMLLHILALILIKERCEKVEKRPVLREIKAVFSNGRLMKVITMSVIVSFASSMVVPFYGTYQLKELGFSMTALALISIACAISRAAFSLPMGWLADKFGFANMLTICYLLVAFGRFLNIFFGQGFFITYIILDAIALAGMNSGAVNLAYDYVPHSQRTAAIAIQNSLTGFVGFFTVLIFRPFVDYVQSCGNKFLFFEHVYAQQVLSAFSFIVTVGIIMYLNFVLRPMKKEKL